MSDKQDPAAPGNAARDLADRLGRFQRELTNAADHLDRARAARQRADDYRAGRRTAVRLTLVLTADPYERSRGQENVALNVRAPLDGAAESAVCDLVDAVRPALLAAEAEAQALVDRLNREAGGG